MNITVWLSLSKPQRKNGKPILKCLLIKAVYKKISEVNEIRKFISFYYVLLYTK